jgi:hypothetical protein
MKRDVHAATPYLQRLSLLHYCSVLRLVGTQLPGHQTLQRRPWATMQSSSLLSFMVLANLSTSHTDRTLYFRNVRSLCTASCRLHSLLLRLQKSALNQMIPLLWSKHVFVIILLALRELRARGIVHKNPSPRNVLFYKDVSADVATVSGLCFACRGIFRGTYACWHVLHQR